MATVARTHLIALSDDEVTKVLYQRSIELHMDRGGLHPTDPDGHYFGSQENSWYRSTLRSFLNGSK